MTVTFLSSFILDIIYSTIFASYVKESTEGSQPQNLQHASSSLCVCVCVFCANVLVGYELMS